MTDAVSNQVVGRRVRSDRRRRGERMMVPDAKFTSYYGRPVLNQITWEPLDIAGYLFLGGLAGASSVLAAGAEATDRRTLARSAKLGAFGAISLSLVALVHDLGRPARFVNMLRVFKPTSPMSVGSWLLTGYAPAAGVAALSDVTGRAPRLGRLATAGAGLLGPAVASYTGVLIGDAAVPAWHDGHRELPFVFVGSAASAAGGLGLLTTSPAEAAPARRTAVLGALGEVVTARWMRRRMGLAAETYEQGRAGTLIRTAEALTLTGAAGAVLGRRSRAVSMASGGALLVGSACTRFGIFHAGRASAADPKYTVVPQRERLEARRAAQNGQGG